MPHTFPPRHSPRRPWTPIPDAAWAELLPFLLEPRSPRGRQTADLRARMDGIFFMATSAAPWRALPTRFGKPDTVSRYFRRLTQRGLWDDLLNALARFAATHPLRAIEHLITRACRRAARLLGLGFITRIRALGLLTALPGHPAKVPDPQLSEIIRSFPLPNPESLTRRIIDLTLACIPVLKDLHRRCGGLLHLTRAQRLAWS